MAQEKQLVNLEGLTVDEVNVLLVALSKLPLESVLQLWTKIKTQAEEQLKVEEVNESN